MKYYSGVYMSVLYNEVKKFKKRYPLTVAWRLKSNCKIVEKYLNYGEEVEYIFTGQKNDLFYDADGKPLCDAGNATFSVAAEWLNKPKNQGTKLAIEAKIKASEEAE